MEKDQLQLARQFVSELLSGTELPTSEDDPCPYLPGSMSSSQGFQLEGDMDGAIYRALMDNGFRRSGRVFYRPTCSDCGKCIPIRIPTESFQHTRSMRRVRRKNAEIKARFGDGQPSDEKHSLFQRYIDFQHDNTMSGDRESFERFLYDSPVPGCEICYYLQDRLVGLSWLDALPGALSSVYMCFDPTCSSRSLGTYSILWEIDYCRLQGIAYYYLGYYIPGSKTMEYKGRFRPAEILDGTGAWRKLD